MRIRFLGFVPLTNGSAADPALSSVIFNLFEGTGIFTSFFKDKKVIKKSQNNRNKVFFILLLIDGRSRIRSRIRICPEPVPYNTVNYGGPKPYGSRTLFLSIRTL
jgi:hypothetical protein